MKTNVTFLFSSVVGFKMHRMLIRALTTHGFTLTLLLTFWGAHGSAQYDLLYQTPGDAVNWSRTLAVADDGAGNSFIAGEFKNTLTLGAFTLTNFPLPSDPTNERNTGFIAKYNSNSASWEWATQIVLLTWTAGSIPYLSNCYISDIARDNTGNVYVVGNYYGKISLGGTTLTSLKNGAYPTVDIFVAKLNANGSFAWAKSLGSKDGNDFAGTIALDGSNNVVIGGTFAGKNASCGYEVSSREIYVAKLSNAGAVQWEKKFKRSVSVCNYPAQVKDIAIDASGNIHICGTYTGTVSFGNGPALSITSINATADAFVAKLNSSGTTQWVRSAGGTSSEDAGAIHTDASGNTFIAGQYGGGSPAGGGISFGSLSLTNTSGGTNPFVAKYSSSGTSLWAVNPNPVGGSVNRIVPHAGAMLISNPGVGFQSISLVNGATTGTVPFDGTGQFGLFDLEVAGSGYLFTLIAQCGTISIGGTELNATCSDCSTDCNNILDNFLVRTGSGGMVAPPIDENPSDDFSTLASEEGFEIFPNPATDQLHITLPVREKETTVFIQNQFGRTVWSEKFESHHSTATISLDGQNFQNGIYFIIFLSDGKVETKRFVIEK